MYLKYLNYFLLSVGDYVGAVFPTMPVNSTSLLKLPAWCGEQNMFNFAANLYTLIYLRLTGQKKTDLEKQAFKYLNIGEYYLTCVNCLCDYLHFQ